jgi:hypothetical protein
MKQPDTLNIVLNLVLAIGVTISILALIYILFGVVAPDKLKINLKSNNNIHSQDYERRLHDLFPEYTTDVNTDR